MCKNSGEGLFYGQLLIFLFSLKTCKCFVTEEHHNNNISQKLSGMADGGICCLAAENVIHKQPRYWKEKNVTGDFFLSSISDTDKLKGLN